MGGEDQKEELQKVLQKLIEPYRQSDRNEVLACLKKQGGLDAVIQDIQQEITENNATQDQ